MPSMSRTAASTWRSNSADGFFPRAGPASRSRDRDAREGCRSSPVRARQHPAAVTPTARRQSSNSVEDVGLAELDAHRTAPRSLRVVALAVPIDAAERDGERDALRRPARDLLEHRARRCGSGGLRSCGTGRFRFARQYSRWVISRSPLRSQIRRSPSSVRFASTCWMAALSPEITSARPPVAITHRARRRLAAPRACGGPGRPPSRRSRKTVPTASR